MYLYVAEFKNGVIKVGRTGCPVNRKTKLRFNGDSALRIHWCRPLDYAHAAEKDLLNRVRRLANTVRGFEWFTGISFATARHMADQATDRARAAPRRTHFPQPEAAIARPAVAPPRIYLPSHPP
jgi:hypothetical protein